MHYYISIIILLCWLGPFIVPFHIITLCLLYIYQEGVISRSLNIVLYIVLIVKGGFPFEVDYNYWILSFLREMVDNRS